MHQWTSRVVRFFGTQHQEILWVLLLWLVVQSTGIIARTLLPMQHEYAGFPWLREEGTIWNYFFNLTQTWDSIHYTRLASGWYSPIDHIGSKDYLYAFFPLYPSVIALVSLLTSNVYIAMVLLSLILPIIASVLLKRFFAQNFAAYNPVTLTVWSLFLPFGLFYFVGYTEALYLILVTLVLGFVLKDTTNKLDWLIGIILGTFIVWTRSVGLLLVGSLFGVLVCRIVLRLVNKQEITDRLKSQALRSFLLVFGGVLGLVSFFVHNWIRTGNFLISRTVQDYFGRGSTLNPLSPFVRGFQQTVSGERLSRGIFFVPIILTYFGYLTWKWRKDSRFGWLVTAGFVYSLATTYLNITADSLASTNRYMLTSPLYFVFTPLLISDWMSKKQWLQNLVYSTLLLMLIFSAYTFSRQLWLG
jgi:hypothetical protein